MQGAVRLQLTDALVFEAHAAVADDDWLGVVNTYRAMSGLGPVSSNDTWSAQGQAHSSADLQILSSRRRSAAGKLCGASAPPVQKTLALGGAPR